jgi:hypothetical protein
VIEVERLGGFCVLVKRQVLEKVGLDALDKWTDLGLFDSDILSVKARQAGFTLAGCRDLFPPFCLRRIAVPIHPLVQ